MSKLPELKSGLMRWLIRLRKCNLMFNTSQTSKKSRWRCLEDIRDNLISLKRGHLQSIPEGQSLPSQLVRVGWVKKKNKTWDWSVSSWFKRLGQNLWAYNSNQIFHNLLNQFNNWQASLVNSLWRQMRNFKTFLRPLWKILMKVTSKFKLLIC